MKLIRDKSFYASVLAIAIPMSMQSLLATAIGMINSLMMGQLGQEMMSAVTLADQMFYMYSMVAVGLGSGLAVVISQYYGKEQMGPIKIFMAMAFKIVTLVSVMFSVAVLLFPAFFMSIYSKDPAVIAIGSGYLRVIAPSYAIWGFCFCYFASIRSMGQARYIILSNLITYPLGVLVSYVLIFGAFGAPRLGITGAAIGVLVGRAAELISVALHMFRWEYKVFFRLSDFKLFNKTLLLDYIKNMLPLMGSDFTWGFAVTVQMAILGNLSTAAVAANNIGMMASQVIAVIFIGVCSAATVLIGNSTGRGDFAEVRRMADTFLKIELVLATLASVLMFASRTFVPNLYNVPDSTRALASQIMIVLCVDMFFYAFECMTIVGLLRGAGSANYAMWAGIIPTWCVSIPLAYLAAFVFRWPIPIVVLCNRIGIPLMVIAALIKIFRGNWVHNVTRDTINT